MKRPTIIVSLLVCIIAAGAVVFLRQRSATHGAQAEKTSIAASPAPQPVGAVAPVADKADPTAAPSGATAAPSGAPAAALSQGDVATPAAPTSADSPAPAAAPPAGKDTKTPQQLAADEAVNTGRFPERLSPNIVMPFDQQAWERDPQAYLTVAEPGRVFATAQPSGETPELQRIGDEDRRLLRGKTVELAVIATPGAPVSFNSFDMGLFVASHLPCITVQADGDGVARARFMAEPGAVAECRVLAGSPMTSGQARFTVTIVEPTTVQR